MTNEERIKYCEEIIRTKPNTSAALNAKRLIRDIREQMEWNTENVA